MKKLSIDEFFGKLEWEGGYPDLASYGLQSKEIANKKIAKLWEQYLAKYRELDVIADQIEASRPNES